jgi:hypothetical protein
MKEDELLSPDEECIQAMSRDYKKLNQMFLMYQQCINQIDDFLEYRYKKNSAGEIRRIILDTIDNLTNRIKLL